MPAPPLPVTAPPGPAQHRLLTLQGPQARAELLLPDPWGCGPCASTLGAPQNTLPGATGPTSPAKPHGSDIPGSPLLNIIPDPLCASTTLLLVFTFSDLQMPVCPTLSS